MSIRLNRRTTRPGFATITALALLGFVAVVLVSLTALTRTQLLYTRNVQAEMQLRQMLLAGERAASAMLAELDPETNRRAIELPDALVAGDAALTLDFQRTEREHSEVRVHAVLNERAATQHLHYQLTDGRWRLQRAELY